MAAEASCSGTVLCMGYGGGDTEAEKKRRSDTRHAQQNRWSISCRWTAKERLVKIAAVAGFAADERTTERCRRVEPRGFRRISKGRSGWSESRYGNGAYTDRGLQQHEAITTGGNLSVDVEEAAVGRGRWRRGRAEEDAGEETTTAAGAIGNGGCSRSTGQRVRLEEDSNRRLRMAGAGGCCDREGNVRWPTIGVGATAMVGNHLATAKAATWEAVVTKATTRWIRRRNSGRRTRRCREIGVNLVVPSTEDRCTSAVDSIMSGACLLLERETYTDEERVTLGVEDVKESSDE
ncbi:hypothetical protein B296_00033127 [Ensete ventricosum]|uniref:Uncharacterized protein n=1 Tax=Ensete ventricosum TaxID=4639 RepID=A0A426Z6R8_ENSVE|nr:hypothetical protein B296_00033127 [Ensete ventricosum]